MTDSVLSAKPLTDVAVLRQYQEIIADLHLHLHACKRFPHPLQYPVLKAFFGDGKRIIMGQCGRSFGKTEDILYIAWRFALTHPGAEIYIICPELKQAKKIYWYKKRVQNYGPRKYVQDLFESKLRVEFTNGSAIILDGCENYDSLRGIKPDLVIYDEFQHHTKHFDEEVMQPNLASGRVSLVVMGTPPKRKCYYTEFRDTVIQKIVEGNPRYFYVELPSASNPINDPEWLEEKRRDLFAKGKQNVWYREYEGKLRFDTESAIFPMFSRFEMSVPRVDIAARLEHRKRKVQYYAIFDPATASCFAALFIAVDPFSSEIFILDVIYEKTRALCTSMRIWARANEIKSRWNDELGEWTNIYDEAETWFANEVLQELEGGEDGFSLQPTHKKPRNKIDGEDGRPGESVLMMAMLLKKFWVNEECADFFEEMENYVKDESGDYPTTDDHLVDCLMYFSMDAGYKIREDIDPELLKEEFRKNNVRVQRLEDVAREMAHDGDYAHEADSDYYDDEEIGSIWN